LSVTSSNGTVTVQDGATALSSPYTVDEGTSLTLTAAAATGYRFSGWTGCDSVSGSTCTMSMSASKSVTANYVQQVTLSVSGSNGTVSVSGQSGSSPYTVDKGSSLTLTASANSGFTFSGWSGDCSGSGTCSLTMNTDKAVTATFRSVNPDAPTLSSVTCSTDNACSISWSKAAWTGDSSLSGFYVRYSTDGTNYTQLSGSKSSTATSATISGLRKNATYYFQVQAFNSSGKTSDWSSSLSAKTPNSGSTGAPNPTLGLLLPVLPVASLARVIRRRFRRPGTAK
jgi:hypothetical protein